MDKNIGQRRSRFHSVAITTGLIAVAMLWIDPILVIVPIALFVIMVAVAPFVQRLGFFLPIITHGDRRSPKVALTFDDGPDPNTTPLLLDRLSQHRIRCAFFVIGQKAAAHPELIRAIIAQGHEIGNHSDRHDNLLMLRRTGTLRNDIHRCHRRLRSMGIDTLTFRPPAGVTNPRLRRVLEDLDMICVGFSCRAVDFGNRRVTGISRRILKKVRSGDIIMLHDRQPAGGIAVATWLDEIERVLSGIRAKGLEPVSLGELIGRPIMQTGLDKPESGATP
jgi:peptidoglycan-N-acetylglucosamine deacetylase